MWENEIMEKGALKCGDIPTVGGQKCENHVIYSCHVGENTYGLGIPILKIYVVWEFPI